MKLLAFMDRFANIFQNCFYEIVFMQVFIIALKSAATLVPIYNLNAFSAHCEQR